MADILLCQVDGVSVRLAASPPGVECTAVERIGAAGPELGECIRSDTLRCEAWKRD